VIQPSLLAHTFASLCFGGKPKVKVVTPTMKEDKNMFPKLKLMLGKLETW
jgi:hypothetical protein